MNSLFKLGYEGDSKDFFIFILQQLHMELSHSLNNNKNNSDFEQLLNPYDKHNAFSHFISDFKRECSIISDIFFGITETTIECLNCKNNFNFQGINNPIFYKYQIFNYLIFPLEEVKNMKNNNFNQFSQFLFINNNYVTI